MSEQMTAEDAALARKAEAARKAEVARQERIKADAAFVADQLNRHPAIYLVSPDGPELAAQLGAANLLVASASAVALRVMEAAINKGEKFLLCCSHGAVGMTDRVEPSVRDRLWRVDLRGEFQTLYCTTDGDDPAPSRHFGDGAYHWGTMPKTIAKGFPKREVGDALTNGWRSTPYVTTLRATFEYGVGYQVALAKIVASRGGRISMRRTAHDVIVEVSMPSERATAEFAADETFPVRWTERRLFPAGPVDVEFEASMPSWIDGSKDVMTRPVHD